MHSRRIDPIKRSTYPFCQGERNAVGRSRMPIARTRALQHRACRLLDDLVFECGNCERALLTISLRYVMSPRRQSPICSPMDPGVQVLDLALEVCLVVLPCQPIHTRCGISLEGEECHPE